MFGRCLISLLTVLIVICSYSLEASAQVVAQDVGPQTTVEVVQLNVTAEVAQRISKLLGKTPITEDAMENVVVGPSKMSAKFFPNRTTKPVTLFNAATRIAKISTAKRNQILQVVDSSENCKVVRTLKSLNPENEEAVSFEGEQTSYQVGHQTTETMLGLPVREPVNEFIEDGLVVRSTTKINGESIGLKSSLIINEVVEVQTFTFYPDDEKPFTVQFPKCLTRQIDIDTAIGDKGVLLVESQHPTRGEERITRQKGAFANNRYINRLFENPSITRVDDNRILFLVTVSSQR